MMTLRTRQSRIRLQDILAIAAATFVGLTAATAHENPKDGDRPNSTIERPATMKIVPADVVEANSVVFIGTGDGSAGFWMKP